MRRIIGGTVLAFLLSTTASADTSSMNADVAGMGILQNEWITAGVNGTAGTFGSGGSTSPGLLFDPAGTGTFDPSYDYLTPGAPFDGFAVKVDGTNHSNNNTGGTAIANDGNGLTDGENSLSWTGGVDSVFNITNTFTLAPATPYVDITSSITMLTDATTLSFGKYIDPDSQGMPGDSSSTDNVLGYGVIPDTNVAFSEATTSRYALGIYTTDTNVTAGVEGWTQEADGYDGTNYTDSDGNSVNYGNSDDTIGISWAWTGVSTGDILTASYAYIFGPSAFDAAEDAITGGAGGGADVSSWGTLTDVGSATDAATSSGSTPTPVITTDTIVDTSRPVLTASITHHDSSVADGVQTIDRELTTTTTTPMRTVTYTDGVETGSVVATSTISSAITDPGSFTGRVDQVTQLAALAPHRGINIGSGLEGGHISHDMGNGYSASSNVAQLSGRVTTDNLLTLGAGIAKIDTTMTGAGSTGSSNTTMLSFEASKHVDSRGVTVTGIVNTASTDLAYNRSIGDFDAAGSTGINDTWGTLTVEKSTGAVRPWAGYTVGKSTVDAYTETGDVQAALSHSAVDSTYNYATVGVNIEAGIFDISLAKDFDDADTTRIGVGVEKSINDRISFNADVSRTIAGDNTSTLLTAGLRINF